MPIKNGKVTANYRFFSSKSIYKESFQMETVKSVRKAMSINDWAVSIDLTDAYLHIPIQSSTQKVSSVRIQTSSSSVYGLTLRNVPKSVDFHQSYGHYSNAPASTHHLGFSLPRRLASKRSDSKSVNFSDKIMPSNYSGSGFPS